MPQLWSEYGGDGMSVITTFIIPFCFGFIIDRAGRNGDTAMVVVAIIGILADAVLILTRG